MAHETWRDVVGYEGYYQVSNLGRVRSVERRVVRGNHTQLVHEKILNQKNNSSGYLRVNLSRNNHVQQMFVHRIVAMAFVDNPASLPVIDHINGNKHDNSSSNLRWCTQSTNLHYTYSAGGRVAAIMSAEKREKQVRAVSRPVVRSDGREYPSVKEAAADLGLTPCAVSHVLNGRVKSARGYSFAYKESKA